MLEKRGGNKRIVLYSFVTEQEKTQMRALLGEVNWIAMNSRPDLAASCSLLQQKTSNAKVEDQIECNRLVSLVRDFAHGCVTIHPIPPSELEFAVWSDASWAHATDKKSQGGYLIMAASRELRIEGQLVLDISPSLEELSSGPASGFYSWCWVVVGVACEAVFGAYSIEADKVFSPRIPLCVSKPVFDHCNSEVVTIKDKRLASGNLT